MKKLAIAVAVLISGCASIRGATNANTAAAQADYASEQARLAALSPDERAAERARADNRAAIEGENARQRRMGAAILLSGFSEGLRRAGEAGRERAPTYTCREGGGSIREMTCEPSRY